MSSRGTKKKHQKESKILLKPCKDLFIDRFGEQLALKNRVMSWWIWYHGDRAGCGYYRCIFPAEAIHYWQNHPKCKIDIMHPHRILYDSNIFKYTDLVQVQRWSSPHHINGINFMLGVKESKPMAIVYDLDDDIYSLPDYNYFKGGGEEQRIPIMEQIIRNVDLLVVSTTNLVDVYKHLTDQIVVIPNYLPKWMWGVPRYSGPHLDNKEMNILWSGSGTHFSEDNSGDFGKLMDVITKNKDRYRWIFFGAIPKSLKSLSNVFFIPWRSMLELPDIYKSLNVDIAIAPLQDNVFNRSKSHLKVLEYLAAGFPGLYSDVEPYKRCSKRFQSIQELDKLLDFYYNKKDERMNLYLEDLSTFGSELWIEENISTRINIYTKLMERMGL